MTEDLECTVCNKPKEQGIVIVSSFICADCEHEIVRTDVQDGKYSFFISQLKQIPLHKFL